GRAPPALQGLWPRLTGAVVPREPQGLRLHPELRRGTDPLRLQSLAPRTVRGAGPLGVPGLGAGRALGEPGVPPRRRPALFRDPGAARVLLVRPRARAGGAPPRAPAFQRGRTLGRPLRTRHAYR